MRYWKSGRREAGGERRLPERDLSCFPPPAFRLPLSRRILLPRQRVDSRVHSLKHLNQNLRIPVQGLHDAVDDLRDVVEIDVQVSFGHYADDSELHLLD